MHSNFDYQTAADLCCGREISVESARKFAQDAKWAHDDRASLGQIIADLRRELALREAEIAMLKDALLALE